jgi:hypothetical protein
MEADLQLIPPHTCNTIQYSRAEGSGDCEQQTVEKIHGVAITTRDPPCSYHVPPKIARTGGRLLRDLLPAASHAGNMGRSSGRIYRDYNLTMLSEKAAKIPSRGRGTYLPRVPDRPSSAHSDKHEPSHGLILLSGKNCSPPPPPPPPAPPDPWAEHRFPGTSSTAQCRRPLDLDLSP